METYTMALFGEAERGEYHKPFLCETATQLLDLFGHPPSNSLGIYYAIQGLLYHRALLFCRVREEGFSYEDYLRGLKTLESQTIVAGIEAFCLPGVGNSEIINATTPLCKHYHSFLITNETDFYDYLTEIPS